MQISYWFFQFVLADVNKLEECVANDCAQKCIAGA